MSTGNSITETSKIADFGAMLRAFEQLSPSKRPLTVLDVSGYPDYENVVSNILGFYFNPRGEHGLGYLLLEALLEMAGVDISVEGEDVAVRREHSTEERKRLDLVILSECAVIGIELKINHWVANPLEHYGRILDRLGREKKAIVKIVLGLRSRKDSLEGGFKAFSYPMLWTEVRKRLKKRPADEVNKWVAYLNDLMISTENRPGQSAELQVNDQFFIEHNAVIEAFIAERSAFIGRLQMRVKEVWAMMNNENFDLALQKRPWIFQKYAVVLDFCVNGIHEISWDLYLRPSGWELVLFGRDESSRAFLDDQLTKNDHLGFQRGYRSHDRRYLIKNWDVKAEVSAVQSEFCAHIRSFADAVSV